MLVPKIVSTILPLALPLILISSCNNNQPFPKCDSVAVKNQLLQLTATKNQSLVSQKSLMFKTIRKTDSRLYCQSDVAYYYQLAPEQKITQNYDYQVNSEYQITTIQTSEQDAQKIRRWLNKLPTIVSQQQTNHGLFAVIQTKKVNAQGDQIQSLISNRQLIKLNDKADYSSITIDKRFIINNKDIFLVSAYYNNTQDQTIAHSYFVTLESSEIKVSKPFSYLPGSIQVKNQSISFNGLYKYPFAEADDATRYQFNLQDITLIKDSKPLKFYQQKYANYNAKQILQQIKTDGCLNGDQFYLSEICSNKISSYCFEFRAMQKPTKDKFYWLIREMCQIQQY